MKKSFKLSGISVLIASVLFGGIVYAKWTTADVQTENLEWAFTQASQQPEKLLIEVIDKAKSTLDIAIYSLTYPEIVDALARAKKRGVAVRVITDRIQSEGKAQTEALKILGSAGVPIKINSHSGLMHLKMTVADNKIATTGSYNYSKAASTNNDELFVVIRNEETAKAFAREFAGMWNDAGRFRAINPKIAQPTVDSDNSAEKNVGKATDADCAQPLIKGNVSRNGDKIYHLPGGKYYEQTIAEEMFCSEERAQSEGFRKSRK